MFNNLFKKSVQITFLLLSVIALCGWPSIEIPKMKDVKSGLINATGVVTSDQVDTVIKAAEKIDSASRGYSQEQQYYLGRGVSALILRRYPLFTANESLSNHVNYVGTALAANSSRPELFGGYHFSILDSDEINALSAPGGFVFISKGFLNTIPNEEALAAVLAHEIGHIILGHGVGAISNAKVSEATMLLGKEALNTFGPSEVSLLTDNFGASIDQMFETLMTKGYSRSQEYEADAFAVNLMAKTGYSAKGLNQMLDELIKVGGQSKGGWKDTHPSPSDRKASLKFPKQNIAPDGEVLRTSRFEKIKS